MLDQESQPQFDPKGYYRALGLGPLADPSEIKAAFRFKAKQLHPDRNPSEEARLEFMEIRRAYEVLSDPAQREQYDQGSPFPEPMGLIDPTDLTPKPLCCSRCGQVTAQPRHLIFHHVRAALWRTNCATTRGIFCRACADRTAILASTTSWILGWWSPTGPYWTLRALFKNLRGGEKPPSDNLWVLLHQAKAFLAKGDRDIARALALQATGFAQDEDERVRIAGLLHRIGSKPQAIRKLKNRWRPYNYATLVQALPLMGLVLAIVTAVCVGLFRTHPDSASAGILVRPAQPGETRHVATEILKVRQGPAASQPVTALLDRFATVQVMETEKDGEWARILTENGVAGYVQSRYLFGGPGEEQKTRWCSDQRGAAPGNGDILLRRSGGDNQGSFKNDSGRDVVVRLKTPSGRTVLAFFIERGKTATIGAIPDGNYRVVFASGAEYSHVCGMFLKTMQTFALPAGQTLIANARQPGHRELSLTLPPIGLGPDQSHAVPDENFLDN